jgi:hypothetical protein
VGAPHTRCPRILLCGVKSYMEPDSEGDLRFGMEPRFGVYSDLTIATRHGSGTQPVTIANFIQLASDAESGDPVGRCGMLANCCGHCSSGCSDRGRHSKPRTWPCVSRSLSCSAPRRRGSASIRSTGDLRRSLSTDSEPPRCPGGRQTRDRHSLAPCWVQSLLALEIKASSWETEGAA